MSGKVKLLTTQLEELESVQAHVMSVNELASKVAGSCDDEMLSGEKLLVHRIHEVTDTYDKLQTDPVESYAFCFTPSHNHPFPQLGQIFNPHPPQCEITDIPPTIFLGQRFQFAITTKDVRGTPLTAGGEVQLDSGRGNI